MWPFSKAPLERVQSPSELQLLERMEKLERGLRDVRLDWDDMYDKFRLLYARATKRIREANALTEKEEKETHQDAPGLAIGDQGILDHPLNRRGPRVPRRNY